MLERLIRFGHQLFNNLDVFCFGIITAIVGTAIIKMIVTIRHNKRSKTEKSVIGVEDLLLPFISIFVIIAFVLIAKSWNGKDITDANVLSAIVSFISPFIAFTGAYSLAEYNNKRSEGIREKEEEKEKEKIAEQERKEREKIDNEKKEEELYAKDMLYSLLEYTVKETEGLISRIHQNSIYRRALKDKMDLKCICNRSVTEEKKLFRKCLLDADINDVEYKEQILKILSENNVVNLVYDSDWTKYMRYVTSKERQSIISWIHTLKNNDFYMIPYNRDIIITILNGEISSYNKNKKLIKLNQILENDMNFIKELSSK